MTHEERGRVKACRVMVVAPVGFVDRVRVELSQLGFTDVVRVGVIDDINDEKGAGILIEYTGAGEAQAGEVAGVPVIYPFDFVKGAGAIVLFPGDDRKFLSRRNLRVWAAEYMAGYCAFWNVEGCEWLHEALPEIRGGMTSDEALQMAAHVCARIAVNIAVGRMVKRYPRFYVVSNGG